MGKFKSKLPPPTHLSSSSSSSGSAPKLTEFFEVECVDIGDHIKIKQCLDEAACSAIVENGHVEDLILDNTKITIMVVACVFAMFAQFGPAIGLAKEFPDSRLLLGTCCAMYFLCSGAIQGIMSYYEGELILTTVIIKDENRRGVRKDLRWRISSLLPRFDEFYTLIIEYANDDASSPSYQKCLKNGPKKSCTWSVGLFFDKEGNFDSDSFMGKVDQLVKDFEAGRSLDSSKMMKID